MPARECFEVGDQFRIKATVLGTVGVTNPINYYVLKLNQTWGIKGNVRPTCSFITLTKIFFLPNCTVFPPLCKSLNTRTSMSGTLVPTATKSEPPSTPQSPTESTAPSIPPPTPMPPSLMEEEPSEADIDKDVLCPICMQIIKDAFMTACGHSFCYMCILTHLRNKSDCPCCSRYLTNNHIFPNLLLNKVFFFFLYRYFLWSFSVLILNCFLIQAWYIRSCICNFKLELYY